MSLNGIGNVYIKIGNLDEAKVVLSAALEGERELGSDLGMAINYANIGSIFESKQMYDSANAYYELSMQYNQIAKSTLGISLCYNHFGNVAEALGNLDEALRQYMLAYNLMNPSKDRRQWVKSCISVVRVYIKKGDMTAASNYLQRAEETAEVLK